MSLAFFLPFFCSNTIVAIILGYYLKSSPDFQKMHENFIYLLIARAIDLRETNTAAFIDAVKSSPGEVELIMRILRHNVASESTLRFGNLLLNCGRDNCSRLNANPLFFEMVSLFFIQEQQLGTHEMNKSIKILETNIFFSLHPDLQMQVLGCLNRFNAKAIIGIFENISDAVNLDVFHSLVTKAPHVFLRLLREPFFVSVVCHPDRSSVGTTNSARDFTSFLWEILKSLRSSHKNVYLFDTRNLPRNMIEKLKKKMTGFHESMFVTFDTDDFTQLYANIRCSIRTGTEDDDIVICMLYKWLSGFLPVHVVTNDKKGVRLQNLEHMKASPFWDEDCVTGFCDIPTISFSHFSPSPPALASSPSPLVLASSPSPLVLALSPSPLVLASSPSPLVLASSPSPVFVSSPSPLVLASASVPPGLCFHCGNPGHQKHRCPHRPVPPKISVTEVDARSLSAASTPATTPNRVQLFLAEVAAMGNLNPLPKAGDKA